MSIPKGLIIYKASRYGHPSPTNIKYGCYSNKAITSPASRETQTKPEIYFLRFQKKFTTGIEFQFDYEEDEDEDDDEFKEIDALKIFSAFKSVKKCIIHWPSPKAIKRIGKLFKTLKQVQKIKINLHFDLIQNSKFFKSLLLVPHLENLSLFLFRFTANLDGFKLLMQAIKQASKRRCWPNFKSLNIDFMNERNPKISSTLHLEKLLVFFKDLKCCEEIYKCTDLYLSLPELATDDPQQTEILKEIAQIAPSLTKIKFNDFSYLSDILKIFKSHKELEGVSIDTYNKLKQKLDVSPLNEIPTLKELTVHIAQKRATMHRLPNDFPIRSRVAVGYHDIGSLKEFKLDISKLPELKSFELELQCEDNASGSSLSNRIWLEEIFQDIGKKGKLEKLCLSFNQLDCDDFGGLLLVLGQSLKELTQLSLLSLVITKSYSIQSKEIIAFCRSISKLNRIRDLEIKFLEEEDVLEHEEFDLLVECIAKSFPFLSNLVLGFTEFNLSRESYDHLCQVVHRMKSLNSFKLKVSSSDIDEYVFRKTIGKTALVEIEFTESSYFDAESFLF